MLKIGSAVRKIMPKLCKECLEKTTHEIGKEAKDFNKDLWCNACTPYIKELHLLFNPISKNLVKDYEKNIKG